MSFLKALRRGNSEISSETTTPSLGAPKLGAAMFKSQQASSTDGSSLSKGGGGLAGLLRGKTLRNSVTSMISMRRMSKVIGMLKGGPSSANSTQARSVNLENTYKTSPDEKSQFSSTKVTKIAEEVLAEMLGGMKYNPALAKELAGELSADIKERVKMLGFQRYKIVCQIIIGERRDQGMEVATRCLWSTETDDWACANFTNDSLFAVAMIHGAFFE